MARNVKRVVPWLASISAVLLGLTGCGLLGGDGGQGGGGQGGDGKDGGGGSGAGTVEPITSRATNVWEMPGGRAEMSLHRVDDEHMVARMAVVNEEDTRIHLSSHLAEGFGESEDYPWDYFSGVAWLDPDGRKLHRPYYVGEGECLCSSSSDSILDEGEEWEGYAVLAAPPAGVDALTVVTHVALPFVDVPVEDGAPEGLDYTPPSEEPDAEPETAELESVIESDQEMVIEDSEATDFNLSTDVLFEVEESELTAEADGLLDTTAADIEALGPAEVRIEGHADSSGSDEINDPLSEERAEAVRDALDERIGGDIEYETEGFGSREPIASNETEDGRARNRRVTISVPKGTPVEEGAEDGGEATEGASPDEDGAAAQGEGIPATEAAVSGPADDDEDSAEVDVALTGLQAVTPNTALLTYELHNPNDDDASVDLYMSSDDWMEFRYHSTHNVSLGDVGAGRAARPLRVDVPDDREDPYCFCSSAAGINLGSTILPPGGTAEYYAMLPINEGTTATDVTVGTMGTMEGVAITR